MNTDWKEKGSLRVGVQVDGRAQRVVVRRAGRHLGVARKRDTGSRIEWEAGSSIFCSAIFLSW